MTKSELKKWMKELLDIEIGQDPYNKNFDCTNPKEYFVVWSDEMSIGGNYANEKDILDMYNDIIYRSIGDKFQVDIYTAKTKRQVYFYVNKIKKERRRG